MIPAADEQKVRLWRSAAAHFRREGRMGEYRAKALRIPGKDGN